MAETKKPVTLRAGETFYPKVGPETITLYLYGIKYIKLPFFRRCWRVLSSILKAL